MRENRNKCYCESRYPGGWFIYNFVKKCIWRSCIVHLATLLWGLESGESSSWLRGEMLGVRVNVLTDLGGPRSMLDHEVEVLALAESPTVDSMAAYDAA